MSLYYIQVSHLCPGEYPTSVDIIIKNSSGHIVHSLSDGTLSLITGHQFVVNEYIILSSKINIPISTEVTFSNLDGEFNVVTDVEFSKSIYYLLFINCLFYYSNFS